ncbi:MAG: hypothetical protein IJA32_11945 [Lachnospiraceae bacterium]|nr:hypothetical protein [Lachnospiraceae bacterium]
MLITILQSGLAYIAGKQILEIGLDATTETCKDLIGALPPLEYMGFDVVGFVTIPLIVLGAIYGAGEYKRHSMRTTLLSTSQKAKVFASKLILITMVSFLLSFLSIFITITVTHATFGGQGLKLFVFNSLVWKFIMIGTIGLMLLTVLSFGMGFLFRTSLVPMLFLIPQVYNLGNVLAEHFYICRFLPVSLVNSLIASSESIVSSHPAITIVFISIWVLSISMLAFIRFFVSDLGGEY